MSKGLIGDFAKKKINDLFDFLSEPYDDYDGKLDDKIANNIIGIVGEPIVKQHLLELFDIKYNRNKELAFINSEIERLTKLKSEKEND